MQTDIMPKRRRSEDEENSGHGLLKTHVSQKEVNMGVLHVSKHFLLYTEDSIFSI